LTVAGARPTIGDEVLPLAISTVALGVAVVGGTILVSVAAVALVRKIPRERLEEHQDVVSVMFSAVGVLYTVLLAFMVVIVWEQFNAAEESTHQEATKISNLLRDAVVFPAPVRTEIQGRLVAYAQSVVDDEWDTMANGESSSTTGAAYRRIWGAYYDFYPHDEQQRDYYAESITRLNDLGNDRRLRVLSSQASIPTLMWILLVAGAVVTIAYLYLFTISSTLLQRLMIGSVTGLLAFILFLVLALDHPFAGDVSVSRSAYEDLIASFENGGYARP
jgi:hypothetical protein